MYIVKNIHRLMSLTSEHDHDVSQEIVTKIAKLSRLRLTEDETLLYQKNFETLLKMFHELDSLQETTDDPIDVQLLNAENCRKDIQTSSNITDRLIQSLPNFNKDSLYFDVPQFIDQDE